MFYLEKAIKQITSSMMLSRSIILSLLFLLYLSGFELLFLSQSYSTTVILRHFNNGSYLNIIIFSSLSIISVTIAFFFFLITFASPRKYQIIYFLLFCLAVFSEYSYQNVFGRFSNLDDAENAFFAADFYIRLNAIEMYFSYLAIIPCLVFGIFLIISKPSLEKGLRLLLLICVISGIFFSVSAYSTRNTYHTISISSFYRTLVSFPVNWYLGSITQAPRSIFYNSSRDSVTFYSPTKPTNNIVFIVDESVRGDYLSLNGYEKPTTPFLNELNQKGFIKNWGVAVSGTTCSMTSNNLLLTGLNKLPDTDFKTYQLPTIFQYAKAMGYKTIYYDGQVETVWNGKPSDADYIDKKITVKEFINNNLYETDAEIAKQIKETINQSDGNFILINKRGVHKPYQLSYPISQTIWLPTETDDNTTAFYLNHSNAEKIINTYNNAILYNSQIFFRTLVDGDKIPTNAFFVYTSDHGQSLLEGGAIASHCSNTKMEAAVPLFIISAPQNLPDEIDTNYKASHENIFATLLDLMKFPENERKFDYSISLLKAKATDSKPRYYFVGDLFGRGSSEKYNFDE